MPRPSHDDWRRASGSLNKRSIRAALFGAAARSADSFSSVAGRWSLSRRRRNPRSSEPNAPKSRRLWRNNNPHKHRQSFHNPRQLDDGTPTMHTNTPFVIRTNADEQRAAAAAAAATAASVTANNKDVPDDHLANSDSTSPRYISFGSDGPSGSLRNPNNHEHTDPRLMHPALRPTFDALRLLRKIPQVMAGWVHVRCSSGAGRIRWPVWSLFWAELRGGYLLLTRECNSIAASDSSQQGHIDYIFGATHLEITRIPTRSGAVRLRLQRVSTRRNTSRSTNANNHNAGGGGAHNPNGGASQPSLIEDEDGVLRNVMNNGRDQRLSERSARHISATRLGAVMKKWMSVANVGNNNSNHSANGQNGYNSFNSGGGRSFRNSSKSSQGDQSSSLGIVDDASADLVLKIPSAPEADKWEWALRNATKMYESKRLGDFQLIDALGAGAFGRVYLVYDTVKREYLALKVLDKSLVFRDRLHFESAVNERLTLELVHGKAFMAQLRYAFQTRNCLYLVTDFYEGGDLFSFLRSHHNDVRESQAIRIIAEVVLALQSMHEMGIVYRDLKPENVLLDKDGHVRLADLGLAKLLDRDIDYLTSTICGSLSYAAPEMLSEKQYGIAFDMWTLGVFIYQVLTGDMPFETENRSRQEILEDQRKADIPVNGLSKEGYELVCALLRPNPLRRPTCQDLRNFPIFSGIDWDELMGKRPHKNSVKNVMDKIARDARQQELPAASANSGSGNGNGTTTTQAGSTTVGGESDVFLLRNFDPDEWSDMSFSDVSDGVSTATIFRPNFNMVDELPELTKMIPGWSLTSDNAMPLMKPQLTVPDQRSGGSVIGSALTSASGTVVGAMDVDMDGGSGGSGAVERRGSRRMSEKKGR